MGWDFEINLNLRHVKSSPQQFNLFIGNYFGIFVDLHKTVFMIHAMRRLAFQCFDSTLAQQIVNPPKISKLTRFDSSDSLHLIKLEFASTSTAVGINTHCSDRWRNQTRFHCFVHFCVTGTVRESLIQAGNLAYFRRRINRLSINILNGDELMEWRQLAVRLFIENTRKIFLALTDRGLPRTNPI